LLRAWWRACAAPPDRRVDQENQRHALVRRRVEQAVASFNGINVPVEDQLKYFYDVWGSDKTYPHMSVAWSWAFDTPFSWTKQIASHFGGVRQGMAISWPAVIKDKGGIRNQFAHLIDIVPTILEATKIKAPDVVDGIKQKPIEGVSFMYTFDAKNAN